MENTHYTIASILFVVSQCRPFNLRLDVASQITGTLVERSSEIPRHGLSTCNSKGEEKTLV
jgi:hypothetical protein